MSLLSRQSSNSSSVVSRPKITYNYALSDQLADAKKSAIKKYCTEVYYQSIKDGNPDLIMDALAQSPQFAALHEAHQAKLGAKKNQQILKGKLCIGYAITWNPPEPTTLDGLTEKFTKFCQKKWMDGLRVFTVDQRGETVEEAHGFHVHAYIPKGASQYYEWKRFVSQCESFFGQTAGPTLMINCVSDLQNKENWMKYINYEKDDDKEEIVATTKAVHGEKPLIVYIGQEDDEEDQDPGDSASEAGSDSSSWISGYSGFQSFKN